MPDADPRIHSYPGPRPEGFQASSDAPAVDHDRRFSMVSEVIRIADAERETGEMLQSLLACLIDTFKLAELGIVFLCDTSTGQLSLRAAYGHNAADLDSAQVASEKARCDEALRESRPLAYPPSEAAAEPTLRAKRESHNTPTTKSVERLEPLETVYLPLISGGTKVGACALKNLHNASDFPGTDIASLWVMADLIALSVESCRLRELLRRQQNQGEAEDLKAGLISTLAHDLRTPLASIKGYATALLMEETSFELETQREFLQIIDEECDTLLTLIHDLWESSIIDDRGLIKLERQPVRLPLLIKNVIDGLGRHTNEHRFLIHMPEHLPIIDADPDRIAQVLRNLLDNAIKYSPEGGLIVVRGEVREDEVVISVADQGVGISAENLNRLFNKFFRAKPPLGRHISGSGLGLPLSRAIVECHQGHIWAESQLGQGTTLYFTLPLEGPSRVSAGWGET